MLSTLFIGNLRSFAFPLPAFVPLGFVTGALNMIVGVIGPVLAVVMARTNLAKEQVVGTLGFFGFIGNLVKIAGFVFVGFSLAEHAALLIAMIPAAMAGTSAGKWMLARLSERAFRIVLQTVLIALAAKLVLIDGLWSMLGSNG